MDYLASQFSPLLAGYLAAIGLLGLLLGWWLGRSGSKRSARQTAAELELRLATVEEEHAQASLEVGRLADQLAEAKIGLETAHESAAKLLSDLSAVEAQLVVEQQSVASFQPLLAKRDAKLEQLRAEQVAYHDRLTTLEDVKRQSQNQIESMVQELSAAQAHAAELETVAAQSSELAQQQAALSQENAELGAEVERLRQVGEEFRQASERAAGRDRDYDQARRQLEDVGQERDRVVTELATLSQRLEQAELERKSHDMAAEAARRELEVLRQRLKLRDEQIAALESSAAGLSQLEGEVESLRGELAASVRRVEDLQQRAATAEALRAAAEAERDQAGRELEALLSAPLIDVDRMATVKPVIFESTSSAAALPAFAPELLDVPRGAADDLRRIRGIGEALAQTLNSLGIYHYAQIAGWSESDIQWVAAHLNTFPDRIERDEWREQAAQLESEEPNRQV